MLSVWVFKGVMMEDKLSKMNCTFPNERGKKRQLTVNSAQLTAPSNHLLHRFILSQG